MLSELRRGLALGGVPNAVQRATRQRLLLDTAIVTDAEVLREALLAFEKSQGKYETQALRASLEQVRGLPFAGEHYAWADAEGITSTFVWLVTRAVNATSQHACETFNDEMLLAATAAGLRMLPGDEEFSAWRGRVVAVPTR